MMVLFSPQVNEMDEIIYKIEGDVITATLNGISEVFDFTGMPDGRLDSVETTLPINVLISAKKEKGVLYVELLNYITAGASEDERFPEWKDVKVWPPLPGETPS